MARQRRRAPQRLPGYRNGQHIARYRNPNYKRDVRDENLRYWYNISSVEYDNMLAAQDYRCAICNRHQDEFERAFAVDHDHECCPELPVQCGGSCLRGLLCYPCNVALGHMKDDIHRFESAIFYLKCHKTGLIPDYIYTGRIFSNGY